MARVHSGSGRCTWPKTRRLDGAAAGQIWQSSYATIVARLYRLVLRGERLAHEPRPIHRAGRARVFRTKPALRDVAAPGSDRGFLTRPPSFSLVEQHSLFGEVRKYSVRLDHLEFNEFRAIRTDRYVKSQMHGRSILDLLTIRLQMTDFGSHEVLASQRRSACFPGAVPKTAAIFILRCGGQPP